MTTPDFWRCPHGMIGTPGTRCPECEPLNTCEICGKEYHFAIKHDCVLEMVKDLMKDLWEALNPGKRLRIGNWIVGLPIALILILIVIVPIYVIIFTIIDLIKFLIDPTE